MFCWCSFGSAAFRILSNGNNSRQRNVQIPLIFCSGGSLDLFKASFEFWYLVVQAKFVCILAKSLIQWFDGWLTASFRAVKRGVAQLLAGNIRAQGSSVVLSSVNVLRYLNTFFGLHYTGHFHLYWLFIRHWGRNARVILKQLRLESLLISCHFAYWISWGFGYVNVLRNKHTPRSV